MHVFDEHCSFAGMRVLPAQCMQREVTTLNTRRESSEKFFAVAFDSLPVPHLVSHYWREWIRKGCSVSIFFFNLSSNEKWLSESFATWLLLRFTIIIIFFNWSRLLFGFGSCYRFPEKKSKYFRFYLDSCVIWESSKINSFCSSCITCGNHVFWWQVLSRPNSIGFYRLIFFFVETNVITSCMEVMEYWNEFRNQFQNFVPSKMPLLRLCRKETFVCVSYGIQ